MEGNRNAGVEETRLRTEGILCWGARPRRERYMILTITTIILIAFLLAFSFASHLIKHSQDGDEWLPYAEAFLQGRQASLNSQQILPNSFCLTKGCVKAAADIIDRMDETADPCDDFFTFACGKFVKNTIIPDEKPGITMFSILQDELEEKLRHLVEEELKDSDPPAFQIVKKVYASCMNTAQIQERGLDPLKKILDDLGGWPVVEGDNWDEANFSWTETNYKNRKLGYSADYLFDFSVITNIRNSTWRMIWFDQATIGISREYLVKGLSDTNLQAYLQYMTDSAILLGSDPLRAKAEMNDVLRFSIRLANISLSREARRNQTELYNTITLADLASLVPDIPWVEYINNLLPAHLKVNETEIVGLSDPNYFTNLTKILKQTPNRVVANYMLWRNVAASASYISEDIRDLQLIYTTTREGVITRQPRWKECMGFISMKLPHGIGSLYIKNFFDIEAKKEAEELVAYVRNEFERILETVDWMDDVTRNAALKKAKAIRPHIGFPDELFMDEKLSEHYFGLVVESKGLLDNMRKIAIFDTDYSFSKLREKIDKLDWKRHAEVAVVNAFYSPLENSIMFPAGILRGVFFEPDSPKYMNYGAIGSVIGHEITHGFDDEGKQFDNVGNLQNWWKPSTEKKFLEKAKCIIYQYGNFTAPENGMKLNGINTQGENIADNGGVREAYNAYIKWVIDKRPEKKLPGLDYTPLQLFWISAAQIWCSKYRPEALKTTILTGVHSPGRFRVNGPFSNSKQFSKDWRCPMGCKMNPSHKCQVW